MSVKANIIKGETLSEDADGFRSVVVYQVTGLSGNANARLYNALLADGVPQFGEPHPVIGGIRVSDRQAKPVSGSSTTGVEITITYEALKPESQPPDDTQPAQVSVGSSLESTVTQLDISGNQILVSHTFVEDDEDGNVQTRTRTQGGEVEYQVPSMVLRFTRRESAAPDGKANAYVGKVNSDIFGGQPAHGWLCTRIEGTSDDGGQTYTVTYEFQRNKESWLATVVYIDPETGRPPPGLVAGQGIKQVQVYEAVPFSGLNL